MAKRKTFICSACGKNAVFMLRLERGSENMIAYAICAGKNGCGFENTLNSELKENAKPT